MVLMLSKMYSIGLLTGSSPASIARRLCPMSCKAVTSALICFVDLWITPAAVIIVIIAREFVVTSLRLIAAPKGIVIAADIFGKMKTVLQMIWVAATIFQMYLEEELWIGIPALSVLNTVLMWLTLALTIVSGVNYLWKNRAVLSDMK